MTYFALSYTGQPPSCLSFTTSNRFINIFEDILISDPDLSEGLVGAPFVHGIDSSMPAYEFSGLGSGFTITSMSNVIREASCTYNEVTFSGRVFIRDSQSDGPLLELSYAGGLESGLVVYLLIIDAAADEIVLGYRYNAIAILRCPILFRVEWDRTSVPIREVSLLIVA